MPKAALLVRRGEAVCSIVLSCNDFFMLRDTTDPAELWDHSPGQRFFVSG